MKSPTRKSPKSSSYMSVVRSEDTPEYKGVTCGKVVPDVEMEEEIITSALDILRKRLVKDVVFQASSTRDVRDYLMLNHAPREAEAFGVMFLDNHHRLLADEVMFNGTHNGTAVYPREIMRRALAMNAAALIIYHNHPSGVPDPSRADEILTGRIKDAAHMLDIRVLDHLVIGAEGIVSFSERGLL